MSELRFNELRDEQVVYAVHRQDRTFLPSRDHCPLCPTRPGSTETEIPLPAFEIAVFDNRFPAFEAPRGAAEVVVYTDDHDASFGTLAAERAEALMWVWRHRYEELGAREEIEYVFIFENRGVEVGVTLHHPHGQIYGFPFLRAMPAAPARARRWAAPGTRERRRGRLRSVRCAVALRSPRGDARASNEPARVRPPRAAHARERSAGVD